MGSLRSAVAITIFAPYQENGRSLDIYKLKAVVNGTADVALAERNDEVSGQWQAINTESKRTRI